MIDPFASVRCEDCGWVHYREHDCPRPTTRLLYWLLRRRSA